MITVEGYGEQMDGFKVVFHADIEVLEKFDQSQAALDYIAKNKCELVFLDIEMPGMSGLELAECIGTMDYKPLIVFVTAYEEYAVHVHSKILN